METILKIENIEKYYGNKSNITKAIDNISFSVEKGEYVAIMGASGSGKTTLLNCISTIDRVSSGHIYVGRDDITKLRGNQLNRFRREELGFIFQDFNLLDTLTAYENIALALSIQNTPAKKIDEKIKKIAKDLAIEEVLNKYPYQMSGGQKQRVASARAIITNPKLILADEPTGALDSKSAKLLLESLKHLNEELSATILMVTHDSFTASYAGRILNANEKRIRYLDRMVRTAEIIKDESADDEVGLNNTVRVYFEEDDEEDTYRIVTTVREDVLNGIISNISPMGKALLGHKVGDRVEVVPGKGDPFHIVIREIVKTTDESQDHIR